MAASRRLSRFVTLEQVIEQCIQGGSDNEGESFDEENDREDEEYLFDDIPGQNGEQTEETRGETTGPTAAATRGFDTSNLPGPSTVQPMDMYDLYESDSDSIDGDHTMLVNDALEVCSTAVQDTDSDNEQADNVTVFEAQTDTDDDDDDDDTVIDSDDYGENPNDLPWVRNLQGFPSVPQFTGRPGLQIDLGDDPAPIDVWRHIIDDGVIKHIKRETNKYAESCILAKQEQGPLEPRSIFATWKKVTKADLYNFLAICLHMGLVKKPQISDYWSVNPSTHTSYAAQIMSRERFTSILAFLHLNDNAAYVPFGEDGHDPIHKIRPFFTHLQTKFQSLYVPEQEICVDEAMCPFKGRSRFRVYMKDKPTKWGFKFYELCESQSGYLFRMELFCGQPGLSNKPHDVVMRLVQPLLKKGYHLYVDNYYCEPSLCGELATKNLKTMVCGTVRKNRLQMPKDLADQPLARGEVAYRRRGNVVVLKWKDKKEVFMLSTMHKPELRHTRGRYKEKEKPAAVIDYIKNMAGVDQSDQMIAYFPMHRKSLKWWKKPFFHLPTLCTIQTMVLLNKHRASRQRKRMPLDKVLKSLLLDLPTYDVPPPAAAAAGPRVPTFRLQGGHFPSVIPPNTFQGLPEEKL